MTADVCLHHFQFWIQKFSMLHFSCSVYCCNNYLRQQEIKRVKCIAVITHTVTGISSFFCTIKMNLVLMVAFLNDICSHGCLVFHAMPELPAGSAYLMSQTLLKALAKKGNFLWYDCCLTYEFDFV